MTIVYIGVDFITYRGIIMISKFRTSLITSLAFLMAAVVSITGSQAQIGPPPGGGGGGPVGPPPGGGGGAGGAVGSGHV